MQGTVKSDNLKETTEMRTFNLENVVVLSTLELASVRGGGDEGIPTPIIVIETAVANTTTVTLSVLAVSSATTTRKKK